VAKWPNIFQMLLVLLKSTAAILATAMFVGNRTTASTRQAGWRGGCGYSSRGVSEFIGCASQCSCTVKTSAVKQLHCRNGTKLIRQSIGCRHPVSCCSLRFDSVHAALKRCRLLCCCTGPPMDAGCCCRCLTRFVVCLSVCVSSFVDVQICPVRIYCGPCAGARGLVRPRNIADCTATYIAYVFVQLVTCFLFFCFNIPFLFTSHLSFPLRIGPPRFQAGCR